VLFSPTNLQIKIHIPHIVCLFRRWEQAHSYEDIITVEGVKSKQTSRLRLKNDGIKV